jgi:hypothetical protein
MKAKHGKAIMLLGYEGWEQHTMSVCKLGHWAAFAIFCKAGDTVAQVLEPLINRLMFLCLYIKFPIHTVVTW